MMTAGCDASCLGKRAACIFSKASIRRWQVDAGPAAPSVGHLSDAIRRFVWV